MRRSWWFGLAGAYAAWRVAELVVSARHERALAAEGAPRVDEPGFPLMVAAHVVPFVAGPAEVLWRRRRSRVVTGASLAALAVAAGLRLWVQRTLGRRWNVRVHAAPAIAVATDGPYRYVRHPNYLAVTLELAALPLAGGAWATAALASALGAVALARRIAVEEAALARIPAWRAAMSDKPRLLPRLR